MQERRNSSVLANGVSSFLYWPIDVSKVFSLHINNDLKHSLLNICQYMVIAKSQYQSFMPKCHWDNEKALSGSMGGLQITFGTRDENDLQDDWKLTT